MYSINYDSIDLFWDSEKIFETLTYKTGVRAKNMKLSDEDKNEVDYIITEDDKEFVDSELALAIKELYNHFIDIVVPESDGYYVSEPSAALGVFISGFAIRCNRDAYGVTVVPEKRVNIVSALCEEFIVNHIIDRWCDNLQLSEYDKSNKEMIKEVEDKLKIGIVYLKKRSYLNSYS